MSARLAWALWVVTQWGTWLLLLLSLLWLRFSVLAASTGSAARCSMAGCTAARLCYMAQYTTDEP